VGNRDIPDAYEFNIDIVGESALEFIRLLPSDCVGAEVHLVCEWDLFPVVWGEKPHFVDHPCKTAGGVGSTREAEQTYSVASVVCITT